MFLFLLKQCCNTASAERALFKKGLFACLLTVLLCLSIYFLFILGSILSHRKHTSIVRATQRESRYLSLSPPQRGCAWKKKERGLPRPGCMNMNKRHHALSLKVLDSLMNEGNFLGRKQLKILCLRKEPLFNLRQDPTPFPFVCRLRKTWHVAVRKSRANFINSSLLQCLLDPNITHHDVV